MGVLVADSETSVILFRLRGALHQKAMAHHQEPPTSSGILPASADLDAYYWDHMAKKKQNLRADLNGNARASNCCTFLGNPRQCLCHLACSTTFATQVSTRVERHDLEGPAETEDHEDHGNLPTNVCQPSIWSLELTASWTAKRGFGFLGHDPLPAVLTMGIWAFQRMLHRNCG